MGGREGQEGCLALHNTAVEAGRISGVQIGYLGISVLCLLYFGNVQLMLETFEIVKEKNVSGS